MVGDLDVGSVYQCGNILVYRRGLLIMTKRVEATVDFCRFSPWGLSTDMIVGSVGRS